jgi:hypothetical protein
MEMIGGMVMEGIWFYWLAWLGWVVVTFLAKKGKLRTWLSYSLLLFIITAHQVVLIYQSPVSIGFLFMMLCVYSYASRLPNHKLLYTFICTVILTFSFVSFHLFRMFDPVWVIFHPSFMVALILTYLVLTLIKNMRERILIFLFGLCHGEVLYSIIMERYSFPYIIGNLAFFDVVALGLLFISLWNGFELVSSSFNQSTRKTNKRKAGII